MKNTELLYYDIAYVLDPFNECSEEEQDRDKEQFMLAIENKDMDAVNYIISLLDEEVEEEKEIICNIKYLVKG